MIATFQVFGTVSPWTPKNLGAFDVDENGAVGVSDMIEEFKVFGTPPGPTSRTCADCLAPPTLGLGLGVCP